MSLATGDAVLAMIKIFSCSRLIFAALLLSLASIAIAYAVGRSQGIDAERGKHNAKTVDDLTALLDAHSKLIADSHAASKAMRIALAARSALDAKATKDLKNALTKTAADRADCRFDDDSMRHLTEAWQRAATAAASGIRKPLPATSGTGQQPR